MRPFSRSWRTAKPGQRRPWRWQSAQASVPCSAHSRSLARTAGCRRLAQAGRAAGWPRRCRVSRQPCYSRPRRPVVRVNASALTAIDEIEPMKRAAATIVREYGHFPGVTNVAGVSYDGTNVWIATGDTLNAIDPASGQTMRTLDVPAHAGTAFDGQYLYQISGD